MTLSDICLHTLLFKIRRVSQTPESVKKLVAAGFQVKVESGAGAPSMFSDSMYTEVHCRTDCPKDIEVDALCKNSILCFCPCLLLLLLYAASSLALRRISRLYVPHIASCPSRRAPPLRTAPGPGELTSSPTCGPPLRKRPSCWGTGPCAPLSGRPKTQASSSSSRTKVRACLKAYLRLS